MATFNGTLRSNEIFSALYNMIISQEVFADNIKGSDLVDKARVDGSLYGDTKLYYSTDALYSSAWGNDAEAQNLLQLYRPKAPECQAISLDVFRQICLTDDDYLSKRAWSDEGAFSSFNSVMLGWIRDTKKTYDGTTYNVFIGTTKSEAAKGEVEVTADQAADGKLLAQALADLTTELTDYTRDFNDYGQLRRYDESDLMIVFNSKYINRITNVDLPVIFNNAGLKATFDRDVLPARYFGTINTSAVTGNGTTIRSAIEQTLNNIHYFPGDIIANGVAVAANNSYTEDSNIVCKIMLKGKMPPMMSAFEVGTSFFNPKSLTETHYLTWGRNTLEYLKAYPFITVTAAAA